MSIRRNPQRSIFQPAPLWTPLRVFILALALFAVGLVAGTVLNYEGMQGALLAVVGLGPTPPPLASELAAAGFARYRDGDVVSARSLLAQAYRSQPDQLAYGYELGRMMLELEQFSEAAALGEELIARAANDVRGYALAARALVLAGDATAAIPLAVNGRENQADFAPIIGTLARAYADIARYQQAFEFGQQAVALAPNDVDVRRDYAYALLWLGRYEEAIEQLETATRLNPNLTAVQFELASYYRRVDEVQRAVGVYNFILEREPGNAKAYLRLCQTYAAEGLFQDAQFYCERAIEYQPQFPQAYTELGRMMYTRRNYEGSIDALQLCVEQGGQAIECWYLRGLAHYRLGQCEAAWEILSESLNRATALIDGELIVENILFGLDGIRVNCVGFANRQLPTPIPSTPVPPPPIGSYGSEN
ncbi:MAG: tetratricopeptide repeat protein [Chloroflexi bacterium]|nr:tetratricopeptide repeat protein [Chloroflexota bacterium]